MRSFNITLVMMILTTACSSQRAPSDLELTRIFTSNEYRFEEAEYLCIKNHNLQTISFKSGNISIRTEDNQPLNIEDSQKIKNFFQDTSIYQMDCRRKYTKEVGQLIAVSFVVYSKGLSVSGRIKAIEHYLDSKVESRQDMILHGELRDLPIKNWYIYESE